MERESISQDKLITIYNICKKRLTITLADFLNNPKCEKIRDITIKRYDALNEFVSSIMNTRRFEIFKDNVCNDFGYDNFTDENIYAFFVDRINEFMHMYGKIDMDNLYSYCLKDKKERNIEIKNCELKTRDAKRIKLNGLYEYLLKDTDIDGDKFINLNDRTYEFERTLLLTIDSNLDRMKDSIVKLDDDVKGKFIEDIRNKYHLVEVNGHYVCRYLFDNFRMIKLLRNSVGYRRLSPDNFMDIFKCSLNVNNVSLAYKYIKRDDSKLIKDAYLELKDNEYFRKMVNFPKDNLGITFSVIKLLGNNLIEVSELNNYLSFVRKVSLSKYVLLDDVTKKNYMKEALLSYKKKLLKGTKDRAIDFIKKMPLFGNLRFSEKEVLTDNYKRAIEEIFTLAYDACDDLDYSLISELVNYVGGKVVQIVMVEAQDEALSVDRLEFVKAKQSDADFYVENYNLFVAKEQTKKLTNQYDEMLKAQEEMTLRLKNLTTAFHKNLDDIFVRYDDLEKEKYVAEIIDGEEKEREERIKVWKEQLLEQFKKRHEDNSYEFFSALYDLLAIYERKTGRKYDPKRCLFSFNDVYNFYYLDDEERKLYEDDLIISEDFVNA